MNYGGKRAGELPLKIDPKAFGGGCAGEYTAEEIRYRMCSKAGCGRTAYASWSACCDDNILRPLCAEHDVELNAKALEWFGDPDREQKMREYIASVEEEIGRPLQIGRILW